MLNGGSRGGDVHVLSILDALPVLSGSTTEDAVGRALDLARLADRRGSDEVMAMTNVHDPERRMLGEETFKPGPTAYIP